MKFIKQIFGGDTRQFGMVFALVALTVLFQWLTAPAPSLLGKLARFGEGRLLTPTNMQNLFNGNSYILILAIGMLMVIVIGHIDLSVGSVSAFVGIVVAMAMSKNPAGPESFGWGIPWWAGILLGLALGAIVGAWQGIWVAYVGIPGFIVTLAGMLLFRGANQYVGQSNTIPVGGAFQYIGAGYLWEVGPDTGANNLTLLLGALLIGIVIFGEMHKLFRMKKIGALPQGRDLTTLISSTVIRLVLIVSALIFATILFATGRRGTSFPVSGIILGVLVLLYGFITNKTIFGRHIYAVGGNRAAAELSGVKSKRTLFLTMMNMSILAAVAGMVFVGRSTASGPFDGVNWELDAIAAVFIGGAAVSGGVGTVIGAMVGGLVMAVLNNGLQLMGVGADMTQIIKGLVLLAAVVFDLINKQQGKPSIIGLLTGNRRRRIESTDDLALSNASTASQADPINGDDSTLGTGNDEA